jgi:hypothetical protein
MPPRRRSIQKGSQNNGYEEEIYKYRAIGKYLLLINNRLTKNCVLFMF